ncbi:RNA polymerase factor sigma-54 [Sphingomonas sp. SUN039]|uniref:RNA polymerase factor sigma-54 n=1 Tax=Sphingomonas sp. SUN039 TaxID=2937787 RepID=UPI0021648238|nr:RNA polymerase factor sigma-54 [Sphingomonas sp. SUN039]UVO55283.1 RNA polymerase factor sigma-54 [Sphingomonas sp. SUN039]
MGMGPRLELRQSQSLVMTPQLQQAIRLLALSNLELESVVAEEVEKNPLLEVGEQDVRVTADRETGDEPAPDPATADELMLAGKSDTDAPLDADFAADTFHHDSAADSGIGGSASGEDVDFDSFAGAEETLSDHLMAQLGMTLDGAALAIARVIVDALDDAGYLTETLRDLSDRLGVPLAQVEAVLGAVQNCDPTGVGARSLSECLALQAKEADRYDPCMAVLIDNLELLAAGRIAQLQRMCGVDDEDMADMIRELRGYDPKPGCRFGSSRIESVTPDVYVSQGKKGWQVEINSGSLPRVLVDRRYHAELAAGAKDKASKAWVADMHANASWLVKALDQRQRTIVSVTAEIVKQQEAFFLHGVAHLRPLVLRTVADAVGLHESTVSRVTSNKYLSCARGVFELKYFFTSGIASADGGENASALAVKAAIKTLIAQEAADAILSDDTLVDLLKEQGFDLARRTVAKYREAIGLGSSVQRRRARAIDAKAA